MRLARGVLVCAVVALSLPLFAGTARACQCDASDPRAELQAADAAAVVVARDVPPGLNPLGTGIVRWHFEVRDAIKGDLGDEVDVATTMNFGTCGLGQLEPGREYGLLLYRRGGDWESGSCSQLEPDELRRASQPLPPPDGSGRTAFIMAGEFGEARSLALDSGMRTLRYGFGEGEALRVAVCPGARTAIELVRTEVRPNPYVIGVRNVATFALVREVRISGLDEPEGYGLIDFHDVRCRDPAGEDVVMVASKGARQQAGGFVLRVDASGQRMLWEGNAMSGVFSKDGTRAYVIDGLRKLSEVDLASGFAREIRGVREEPDSALELDPDGRRLAWSASIGRASVLCVVDLTAGTQRTLESPAYGVAWTSDGRVLLDGDGIQLFGPDLKPMTSWGGWLVDRAHALLVAGDRLYGYGNGLIQEASSPAGGPRIVRLFDGYVQHHLVAVPAPDRDASASRTGLPSWALVAALLSLTAIAAAMVVRSRH